MRRPNPAKEQLIASATRLFHQRGYQGISIEDLCADADVNKGSFYHAFTSKKALILAALDAQWNLAQLHMLGPAFAPDISPLARIERFFTIACEANLAAQEALGCFLGCPFGNRIAELGATVPEVRERLQAILADWTRYFQVALEEAVTVGELLPHDTRASAKALLAFFQGAMLSALASNNPQELTQLSTMALRLVGPPIVRPAHRVPGVA
jgi:TetR/AcrR family transcriptional repressor of nem operon